MSSEEVVSPPLNIEKCSLVLVDVAGTTTSIGFVKDTLFPFFLQRIDAFLQEKWEKEAVKAAVKQLQDGDLDVTAAATLLKSLTEEDSHNPGLKALQGLVYEEGYANGDLKAHVFDDVKEAFETWAKSRHIAIYSTGSVDSQKMLFTHTVSGDISAHIHKYYDQEIGSKTEAESYKKIVEDAKVELQEVVFITDDVKEATAAKSSGIHAVLIKREGNAAFPEDTSKDFTIISSFNELVLEKAPKRRIEEEGAPSEAPPSKVPKTDPAEEKEESAPFEKLEKIEEEMEVDDKTEETKTATEETEKLVENTPEKTDIEIKDVEVENKVTETTCIDTEMKDEEKVVASSEAVVEEPQAAVEETETKTKEVVIETQVASEAKTDEAQIEEKSADTDRAEEKTGEAHAEEKAEESKIVEKKTEEAPIEEKKDESPLQDKTDEPTPVLEESKAEEENTPTAVEEKAAETKTEEAAQPEESKVEDTKVETNGDAKEEEEAEKSAPKVEEKENKSVLANGVENGKKEGSEEAPGATVEAKDDEKDEETEVKVKKLEESAESKTVSVEV